MKNTKNYPHARDYPLASRIIIKECVFEFFGLMCEFGFLGNLAHFVNGRRIFEFELQITLVRHFLYEDNR